MRALVLRDGAIDARGDVAPPPPRPGETRVRVRTAGICATDLALRRGYMGFEGVPGHEFVGVALDGPLRGERVVGEINAGCGRCASCRGGDARHCPERTVLGILGRPGAFAEELRLPDSNLHRVPEGIADDAAVFVEPLAAAFEIVEQLPPGAPGRALVAGDGRLGLLCAWVLDRAGFEVTVAGRHPERRALLPSGVTLETGILERDVAWTEPPGDGRRFDLAVEATGRAGVLARLVPRVRPRGTIVLKTTLETAAPLDTSPFVVNELTVLGSRCGPFAPALEALASGAIPVERWIEARYPLEEGARAFDRAARPGTLKVLLDVGD